MREILFRGKRKDNGAWVSGSLFSRNMNRYIFPLPIATEAHKAEVDPETVGQFTGLTAKNGAKIFEGDIMRLCEGSYPLLVYWDGKGWAWLMNGKRREIDHTREYMEIIGNIHDNPELLEDGHKCSK